MDSPCERHYGRGMLVRALLGQAAPAEVKPRELLLGGLRRAVCVAAFVFALASPGVCYG
jgi:hypothetical protein